MKAAAMDAEPVARRAHVYAERFDDPPEAGPVVRDREVGHLVRDHVVKNEGRCHDQTPRK